MTSVDPQSPTAQPPPHPPSIEHVPAHPRCVSRAVTVPAPAAEIFELLADPRRHAEFDGSGTVGSALVDAPARLSMGASFGMHMRLGVPYTIHNTVVEFEEGRRIAWRHAGRHVWRYELTPTADGQGTRVTESFDYAGARSPRALELTGFPARNARGIEATLRRLAARFA